MLTSSCTLAMMITAIMPACLGDDPVLTTAGGDGSATEASTTRADSSVDDGAPSGDGGGGLGDGGGSPFDALWTRCSGSTFACEDFDDAGATSGWILDRQGDGGILATTASASPSPPSAPNVMDITAPPGTRVWLTFSGALQGGGVDCTFAMKIKAASQPEALFAQLFVRSNGSATSEITVHSSSVTTSTTLADGGVGRSASNPLVFPPPNTWFRVKVSTRLTGRTFVTINDDPPVLDVMNTATETPSMGIFSVGASVYDGIAAAWMLSVDNILCVRSP